MGKRIGYLRVSTPDQKLDRQYDGLRDLCDEMHMEKLSAVAKHRPVYERVLSLLKAGDMLVVWSLDRAFRSTIDAITQAELLRARGVEFQIINLQVDTTTPSGKFIYTMMAGHVQFERENLILRTNEGLAAARARGKRLGRPPKLSADDLRQARFRIEARREKIKSVANDLNVRPWSLTRALRRCS